MTANPVRHQSVTEPFIAANGSLIQLFAGALATTPGLSNDDRNQRAGIVVSCLMAFVPLNPVMTMLASQAVGHHLSMLDILKAVTDRPKVDAESIRLRKLGIAESRMMLALIKELRIERKEHMAMLEAERDGRLPVPPKAEPAPSQTKTAQTQTDPGAKPAEVCRETEATRSNTDGAGQPARNVPGNPASANRTPARAAPINDQSFPNRYIPGRANGETRGLSTGPGHDGVPTSP